MYVFTFRQVSTENEELIRIMTLGVSNCGMSIVKGSPPASKIYIAYFEAWNNNRPCLNMDVDMIDTSKYTHIHFAFAEVTRDFKVDISKVNDQFERFKAMSGVKKIISFGGWDFSALPGTYSILREAVKPENREKFKNSVVDFVNEHNLDGVDLDWEYPGVRTSQPQIGLLLSLARANIKNWLLGS